MVYLLLSTNLLINWLLFFHFLFFQSFDPLIYVLYTLLYSLTRNSPCIKNSVVHHDIGCEAEFVRIVRDVHAGLLIPSFVEDPRTTSADTANTLTGSLSGRSDRAVFRCWRIRDLSQQRFQLFQIFRSWEIFELTVNDSSCRKIFVGSRFRERTWLREDDNQQQPASGLHLAWSWSCLAFNWNKRTSPRDVLSCWAIETGLAG